MLRHHLKIKFLLLFVSGFFFPDFSWSQYQLNGNAVSLGGNCYQLTDDLTSEAGSMWYQNTFDLTNPLDLQFSLFLGCSGYSIGADGICFVLQPLSVNAGSSGGGMGFQGIVPSLGVEFDTYQNGWDPFYCHVAIEQNGDIDHTTSNLLAGPVELSPTSASLPDCASHNARITWDPVTHIMNVYFDCSLRVSYTGDIVNSIFSGNPNVYWGFTGATGGASNQQQVCIINSYLNNLRDTTICPGASVPLSVSGGTTYSWTPASGLNSTTIANPIATPTATTHYFVTITDNCGFQRQDSVLVTVNNPTITVNSASTCLGQTVAHLTANGASTYSWSPATGLSLTTGTNVTASPVVTTTYTVTGTDANGCSKTATATVTVNPLPSFSINDAGICTGQTTATLIATNNSISYNWNPSAGLSATTGTTVTANPSATTTYTVQGTDGNGCFNFATPVVTVNSIPVITAGSYTVCNGNSASITAGGASTYNWNPVTGLNSSSGSSVTASPTVTTTYTVTGTDANGCTATKASTITVVPSMTITLTATDAACASNCNGQVSASVLPAAGPFATYSYLWSNAATTSTINNLCANNYSLTVTDLAGCTATGNSVVSNLVNPLASFSQSPDQCFVANNFNFTNTGSTGAGWSYSWSLPGATPSSSTNENLTGITYSTTGNFTVSLTVSSSGCSATSTSSVNVLNNLVFSISGNDTICQGNNSTWNITGPTATYSWNPGALSGTSQTLSPVNTTTYTVNAVDANGCTGSQTFYIAVAPTMTLQAGGFATSCNGVCDGQAVVLVSPSTGPFATYIYNWSSSAGNTPSISNLCPANYTISVTDLAGCVATSSVVIAEPTAVTATSSNITDATCNAVCDGSVLILPGGGSGSGYTYIWTPAGSGNNPANLCAANYTVTVKDANGCQGSTNFTISEPAPITASVAPVSPLCVGQTANLNATANGGNGGYIYSWSAGTTPSNSAAVTASPTVTTSYTVTITDASSCPSATAVVTVTMASPLSITASADVTICNGQNATLSAMASGGDGNYTYTWLPATTPSAGTPVSVSPAVTTTYTVSVSDGCGTTPANDNVSVNVNPTPTLSVTTSSPNGCPKWCVTFTAISNPASSSCNWIFSNGDVATNICNPQNCFSDPGSYGITLNVTDVNGCTNSLTQNNIVTVYPVPVPEFSFGPQPVTELESTISFTDLSQGANISGWHWNFGNPEDSISFLQNPQFHYTAVGSYNVELIATNSFGCADTVTHIVKIDEDFVLYVPNSFTPNGDEMNDSFGPKGIGIDTHHFEMWIYDRWGKLAYYTNNFFKPWDGKVSEKADVVEEDVYVWKIKLKDFNGSAHSYIGHVTVVR